MSILSKKALDVAITQIGQTEKPLSSNWGEPVRTYLASVGINFPASWCMAFIYWCFMSAAKQLGISNTAIRTGGVLNAWNEARDEQKSKDPYVGSIFIMDFGHGLGHTGIVEKIDDEFIYTIEGNTNLNGNRNGTTVERKKRDIKDCKIKGYLNY